MRFSYVLKKKNSNSPYFFVFSRIHANFMLESRIEVYYGTVRGRLGQLIDHKPFRFPHVLIMWLKIRCSFKKTKHEIYSEFV